MKKIEAVIRPEKLDAVRHALEQVECGGLMISEIEGHGKQKGVVQQWRGEKYRLELLPKIKIALVVKDADVDKIVKTIISSAKTGEIGDGKIFISNIENVIRIRTEEKGEVAI
ncbi:MAG: P-II family nitrogen regulator [Candidatus Omnitrophica bacterium]|nr:P-II family nitrogen regulator [Candidatus Omnitrophota bacterium]MDD5436271.1 P-II family nitrogen regulator [Candidatus Omnitrophota bacterium]